jgi:MFS family permease
MQRTGQAWLVLKLTGSPLALGTVTMLQFLPITLLTLIGGVFADRWPKRRILLVTQSVSLVQALVLGVLVATDGVALWHVYALALVLGLANAFDGPVRQSLAVELVGREHLANAVALNSTMFNLARVFGPALAGVTIAAFGVASAFLLNAASFVAVISALIAMRPAEFHAIVAPGRRAEGNVLRQILEGMRYAWHTPQVMYLFILAAFIGTFGFNFTTVIPLAGEFLLHVGAERFGLLTAAMGLGSLIAALAIAAAGRPSVRMVIWAAAGMGVSLAGVALSGDYWLTSGMLAGLGVASILFSTTASTRLQFIIPDELRGRVMSIHFLLMAGSTPLGGFLTGFLAENMGVRAALLIEAAACAAGVGAALAYRLCQRTPVTGPVPSRTPAAAS